MQAHDETRPRNAQHRPLQEILGDYDFGTHAAVYPPGIHNPIDHLTELHEMTHLNLCASSSFGLFQLIVGRLSKDPKLPDELRRKHASVLDATVEAAWATHEGAATAYEFPIVCLLGEETFSRFISSLPDEYCRALLPFVEVLQKSSVPLVPIGVPLSNAIARVALGTTVLEDMRSYKRFLETDWPEFLSRPENNPDSRLERLFSQVLDSTAARGLRDELWGYATSFLSASTVDEFNLRFLRLDKTGRYEFDRSISESAEALLASIAPFPVRVAAEAMIRAARELDASWYKWLASRGVQPSSHGIEVAATYEQTSDHFLDISYEPRRESRTGPLLAFRPGILRRLARVNRTDLCVRLLVNIEPSVSWSGSHGIRLLPGEAELVVDRFDGSPISYKKPRWWFLPDRTNAVDAIAIRVEGADLRNALTEASSPQAGAIIVTLDTVWQWLSARPDLEAVFDQERTIVMPMSSALRGWQEAIEHAAAGGRVTCSPLHDEELGVPVFVARRAGGKCMYARPTSHRVIARLLEKASSDKRLTVAHAPRDFLSEQGYRSLLRFVEHFLKVGY
jgi:hypothetical protein